MPFTMAAVAVDDGAVVVGSVAVRGRNARMVRAENVVEATYDGEAVVVTVTGETRSLLDGTAVAPPTGSA